MVAAAPYRWGDVPLADAMVAWTPAYGVPGYAEQCAAMGYRPGSVEVGPHPDHPDRARRACHEREG